MKPSIHVLTLLSGALLAAATCPGSAQLPLSASSGTPYATGLNGPRGLAFGPDGTLYVAEAGLGGTTAATGCSLLVPPPIGNYKGGLTGRISKVDTQGNRTTLASGLASDVDAQGDISGVADVAFLDGKLYGLVAAGGCDHGNPDLPNGIVKVNLSNGKWSYITDLTLFYHEHPAAYVDQGDFEPAGVPYSMTVLGDRLFVAEANHGQVTATTPGGDTKLVLDVSRSEGHIVPTSIATNGENLYLGNLGQFPIEPTFERVITLSKDVGFVETMPGLATKPGQINKFRIAASRAGFTTILSLKIGPDGLLYALEFSDAAGYPTPGAGKVVRLNADGTIQEIVTGLTVPTGMTFGPDNALYVSNLGAAPPGAGQVLRFVVPM